MPAVIIVYICANKHKIVLNITQISNGQDLNLFLINWKELNPVINGEQKEKV